MSDDAIRLLTQAGEVTILSIALVAFCLVFGPALFKLIGTMTGNPPKRRTSQK